MFDRRVEEEQQEEFWIAKDRLPKMQAGAFYRKLEETLRQFKFAEQVWKECAPAYADEHKGGRPGIDPVVYFKMLMIGFFENLPSERAIAARCEDSLSLRSFLGYDLQERTPDHSSLTVIRQRLPLETYQRVFELILQALLDHGLLKGRNLGIDSSVIEANASLRSLVHRNNEQAYWDYVKALAKEAGIDPAEAAAVRRFDAKRKGRKTSNRDWKNPHDEDAKVGRTKHGKCAMIYKPENTVDLDTGAIIRADVLPGDQADSEQLCERVIEAVATVHEITRGEQAAVQVKTLTADKGYHSTSELEEIQAAEIKTVIGDANAGKRRQDKLTGDQRRALSRAQRAVKSSYGKELLRRRGMHLERSFEHLLDEGGLRRATLRGRENLAKRYKMAAATYNLSQLMRKLIGIGTPKQWRVALKRMEEAVKAAFLLLWHTMYGIWRRRRPGCAEYGCGPEFAISPRNSGISTVC